MNVRTDDLRIRDIRELTTPETLMREFAITDSVSQTVAAGRAAVALPGYPHRRRLAVRRLRYVAVAMEKPLTARELEVHRRRLLDELAGRARGVEAVEAGALQPSGATRFQDVDESVEEAALDVELSTLAAQDRLGYAIHEALQRIADGTFGRCEGCGQPIGRRRLELVPHASRCMACERTPGTKEVRR